MNLNDLLSILPVLVLAAWACILLLVDVFFLKERKGITAILAAVGLAGALAVTLLTSSTARLGFGGMAAADSFAAFLSALFLASGLFAVAQSYDYLKRMDMASGEYYVLMLFAISGMMLMAYANDLIMVFLALELLSIPLYVLAGSARPRVESEESALKYFMLGAFASGFVVYGIALVYGATGSTGLQAIVGVIKSGEFSPVLLTLGAALILVGLGFKVGAVPFHMWSPDVYQGAPSPITSFMAVGAKAGGFAALLRVFAVGFAGAYDLAGGLTEVFWGLAAVTLIVGNLLAISQVSIKRMLAYSSISQAGYILMAFVPFANRAVSADSVASALFYLLAFTLTSFGVWAVVISLEQVADDADGHHKGLKIADYAGLGRKRPLLAAIMTIFMLSLTGLPPTLGFAGKLFLFRTTIEGGFVGLAVIGVITSLISAYYYLRVVVLMYMHEGNPEVRSEPWLNLTAAISAACVVILAIFASPLFDWAAGAVLFRF